LLQKALGWMRQAVEVYESPEAIDTYARLLYKTGEKDQAIEWQQKAIKISNVRGQNTKKYEDALSRMKAGLTKID
jgi:tetratricopeptide (TPR) repeat protein